MGGIWDLPWWGYIAYTLLLTHITIVAVTVYLHRHQAHRAVDLHPIISHFFRFWLWLTTAMVTRQWVAVHRKHHARVETAEDPHSPVVFGIRKVLLEGAELYRAEARDPAIAEKYGHGTPDDWLERNISVRYPSHARDRPHLIRPAWAVHLGDPNGLDPLLRRGSGQRARPLLGI